MSSDLWVLSLKRPWPWAILDLPSGVCVDVLNVPRRKLFRGRVLIHARRWCTKSDYWCGKAVIEGAIGNVCDKWEELLGRRGDMSELTRMSLEYLRAKRVPELGEMAGGAIVGWAEVTGCVERYASSWFRGPYGLILGQERGKLSPIPCRVRRPGLSRAGDVIEREVRMQQEGKMNEEQS